MKIGIITFHRSNNFGAVLQAIALIEFLNKKGYNAKIIDYKPKYKIGQYNLFGIFFKCKSIKHFLYNIYSIPNKYKINKEFQFFRKKYMKIWERAYCDSNELINNPPKLDLMITGSDQVWNTEALEKIDPIYYLGFGDPNIKKASYAASFGKSSVDKKYWNDISYFIKKLDAVSVREIEGKKIVKEIARVEATHALDPVFLLDKNEWNKYTNDSMLIKKSYVLIYARQRSKLLSEIAHKIAEEKKLKIINISSIMLGLKKYDKNMLAIGPDKFLNLFKNASVICTNSFHGLAFSIIYNKPFLVVPHRTRNTRINSILNILRLSNQLIISRDQLNRYTVDDLINYNKDEVNHLLKEEKIKSIEFLKKVINK